MARGKKKTDAVFVRRDGSIVSFEVVPRNSVKSYRIQVETIDGISAVELDETTAKSFAAFVGGKING